MIIDRCSSLLRQFSNRYSELHSLGLGGITTFVLLFLPVVFWIPLFLGLIFSREEIDGEGHYFLIALTVSYMVFEGLMYLVQIIL